MSYYNPLRQNSVPEAQPQLPVMPFFLPFNQLPPGLTAPFNAQYAGSNPLLPSQLPAGEQLPLTAQVTMASNTAVPAATQANPSNNGGKPYQPSTAAASVQVPQVAARAQQGPFPTWIPVNSQHLAAANIVQNQQLVPQPGKLPVPASFPMAIQATQAKPGSAQMKPAALGMILPQHNTAVPPPSAAAIAPGLAVAAANPAVTTKGKRTADTQNATDQNAPKEKKPRAKPGTAPLKFKMPKAFHDSNRDDDGGFPPLHLLDAMPIPPFMKLVMLQEAMKVKKQQQKKGKDTFRAVKFQPVPEAEAIPSGFEAVAAAANTTAAKQFHISHWYNRWSRDYKDHVVCFQPKVQLEISVKEHDELFNYEGGCYDFEPRCPCCRGHAECYDIDNPIINHIKTKGGFDARAWVRANKLRGREDDEMNGFRICEQGHLTLTIAEDA